MAGLGMCSSKTFDGVNVSRGAAADANEGQSYNFDCLAYRSLSLSSHRLFFLLLVPIYRSRMYHRKRSIDMGGGLVANLPPEEEPLQIDCELFEVSRWSEAKRDWGSDYPTFLRPDDPPRFCNRWLQPGIDNTGDAADRPPDLPCLAGWSWISEWRRDPDAANRLWLDFLCLTLVSGSTTSLQLSVTDIRRTRQETRVGSSSDKTL